MSTGAVFKLLVNDGKSDRMILATKLLYQRIQDIMYMRSRQGRDDITPTLIDLERTHIIYVNAHFKPFAAIGYEYNKVTPSGIVALGSSVQFSIPQFGDFFHDMVCRVQLSSVQGATGTTPKQQEARADETTVLFPVNISQVAGLPSYSYNIVDFDGNLIIAGTTDGTRTTATYRNLVRYCEFPGNRLFSNVSFDVNGNPLDSYDYWVPVMLEKFTILPHKRDGYHRLVGQQVPLFGVSSPKSSAAYDAQNNKPQLSTYAAAGIGNGTPYNAANVQSNATYPLKPQLISKYTPTQSNQTVGLFHSTSNIATSRGTGEAFGYNYIVPVGFASTSNPTSLVANVGSSSVAMPNNFLDAYAGGTSTADVQYDISSEVKQYVNGPQVPKVSQPPLEIWNKLRFWFNDDVKLSIPSVSIPYGQRFITIILNTPENLVYETPSLYLETISSTSSDNIAPVTGWQILASEYLWNSATYITDTLSVIDIGNIPTAGGTLGTLADLLQDNAPIAPASPSGDQWFIFATAIIAFQTAPNDTNADVLATAYNTYINSVQTYLTRHPSTPNWNTINRNLNNLLAYYNDTQTAAYVYYSYTPIYQMMGLSGLTILNMELYINNIFVNPEVHDIFIRRVGFTLIRVYREQQTMISSNTNSVLLSALKWPVEYMFIGVQPVWNQNNPSYSGGFISGGNVNVWRDWHRMTYQLETTALQAQSKSSTGASGSTIGQVGTDKYYIPVSTVDSVSMYAHGITIYDTTSDAFYGNYLTFHYGEQKLVTPYDTGCFLINMSLFPRSYQPSGHINISRARETYININSSYLTRQTPGILIIVAVCMNFLLISDGNAVLRYST